MHGTRCLMKQLSMFGSKIMKMGEAKKAVPLIPNSPGGTDSGMVPEGHAIS